MARLQNEGFPVIAYGNPGCSSSIRYHLRHPDGDALLIADAGFRSAPLPFRTTGGKRGIGNRFTSGRAHGNTSNNPW
jgi:hypothetical protein